MQEAHIMCEEQPQEFFKKHNQHKKTNAKKTQLKEKKQLCKEK